MSISACFCHAPPPPSANKQLSLGTQTHTPSSPPPLSQRKIFLIQAMAGMWSIRNRGECKSLVVNRMIWPANPPSPWYVLIACVRALHRILEMFCGYMYIHWLISLQFNNTLKSLCNVLSSPQETHQGHLDEWSRHTHANHVIVWMI